MNSKSDFLRISKYNVTDPAFVFKISMCVIEISLFEFYFSHFLLSVLYFFLHSFSENPFKDNFLKHSFV